MYCIYIHLLIDVVDILIFCEKTDNSINIIYNINNTIMKKKCYAKK